MIVEDVVNDAKLEVRELKRAGIACDFRRVDTAVDYRRELEEFKPQVILSDFSMPQFDGMEALAIARQSHPYVPFIIVSGTLGEEYAVRALKNGAADYVLKSNLIRLPAAVARAVEEAGERQARRALEHELQSSERRYRQLFESNPQPMWVYDVESLRFLAVNDAAVSHYGLSRDEFLAMTIEDIRPTAEQSRLAVFVAKPLSEMSDSGAWHHQTKDGRIIDVEISSHDLVFEGKPARIVVAYDITERKRAEEGLLRFRMAMETSLDGVFLMDFETFRYLDFNETGCRMLGYSRDELLTMRTLDTNPNITEADQRRLFDEAKALGSERVMTEPEGRTMRHKDGSVFPIEVARRYMRIGEQELVVGIARDVTSRKEAEERIKRLNRVYAVLSGINAAIVRIRDRGELFKEACRIIVEDGRFTLGWIGVLNRATGKLIAVAQAGLPEDWDAGSTFFNDSGGLVPWGAAEFALREKCAAIDNVIDSAPELKVAEHESDTLKVRRAAIALGGKSVIVLPLIVEEETFGILTLYAPERNFFDEEEIRLLTELSGDIAFALTFIDKEEKLNYLAYYDALTGLPNSTLFHDRLTQFVQAATRSSGKVATIVINLDRFRNLNESIGRHAGDRLLKLVGKRLSEALREPFSVARMTADTFAVAIADLKHEGDVVSLLEGRIFPALGQPFELNDAEIRVSARAGIAMYPGDGADAETLFRNAEAALKRAKSLGDQYLFYAPEMNARVAEKVTLENQLRQAIEREEFVLYYQPKVTLADGRICGLEALIRWNHPKMGLVPPMHFIPLLEETGLILQVGAWALKQAVSDYQALCANGLDCPRIAVNVSPLQLRQKDFAGAVADAIGWSTRQIHGLDLEITESVIMENIENNITQLKAVREMGLNIAIDDFGTGYSSLAYIAKLPVNTLKIDRSFVLAMGHSAEDRGIVSTIISLAHSLNLQVVAEGVETQEQRNLLRRLQCDEMQGYLFSAPVPIEQIEALLRRSA
ncbi:MAG: EAL domain-containing protein [Betaproteobacteria bacterium]